MLIFQAIREIKAKIRDGIRRTREVVVEAERLEDLRIIMQQQQQEQQMIMKEAKQIASAQQKHHDELRSMHAQALASLNLTMVVGRSLCI